VPFLHNASAPKARSCLLIDTQYGRSGFSEQNRGDKTPLELFLAGVRGWETGLRRRMDGLVQSEQ
jgi:hypothetical protein